MPTTIPRAPQPAPLRLFEVGRPVSSSHGRRLVLDAMYLLGYNVMPVHAGWLPKNSSSGDAVVFGYQRSPYVQVLQLVVEPWDAAGGDSIRLAFTLNGAPVTPLNGVATPSLACPPSTIATVPGARFQLDVTGLSPSSVADVGVTWTSITGGAGLAKLTAVEVPLADSDVATNPASELGTNGAWPNPPNTLIDGTTSDDRGFVRAQDVLDQARYANRIHRQLCWTESTACAPSTASTTYAALTYPGTSGGLDPQLALRARRVYDTGTPNACLLRCRYRADAGGTLAITIGGVQTALVLGATAGAFAASGTVSVVVPTNTTDQEFVGVTLQGKTANGADPLYVSDVLLLDAET